MTSFLIGAFRKGSKASSTISSATTITPIGFITDIHCGHPYVDLGLASGILWSTANVGAVPEHAASATIYGDYYGWDAATTTYPPSNDVATALWGGAWRMPTPDDFKELYLECTWTWVTVPVNGYKVASKVYPERYMFLPAAGYRYHNSNIMHNVGIGGYYWSSVPDGDTRAWNLDFIASGVKPKNTFNRYNDFTIRPVMSLSDMQNARQATEKPQ